MCNFCDCDFLDQCSIRGYSPVGSCCEKCGFITEAQKCARLEMKDIYDDPEEYMISKTINNLEKKIVDDLNKFKNELLSKKKQKVYILKPK